MRFPNYHLHTGTMDKHDLRHELKAAVAAIPQQEKSIRAKKAIRLIEDNALFKQAHSVMAYFPLPDEIDISSALPRWADEKELLLPAMENGLIVPKKYVPQLVRGDFGVMQPEGGPFPIDEIDCIIVPGLGFTLEGVLRLLHLGVEIVLDQAGRAQPLKAQGLAGEKAVTTVFLPEPKPPKWDCVFRNRSWTG